MERYLQSLKREIYCWKAVKLSLFQLIRYLYGIRIITQWLQHSFQINMFRKSKQIYILQKHLIF